MAAQEVDVLVIGAGPTGLGAAKRLDQLVRRAARVHTHSHTELGVLDAR